MHENATRYDLNLDPASSGNVFRRDKKYRGINGSIETEITLWKKYNSSQTSILVRKTFATLNEPSEAVGKRKISFVTFIGF